jgi:hypothetical protein
MMKREPVLHGFAVKPLVRRISATRYAIDDSEGETEFRFEFIFPLRCHRRRRGHDNQVNPPAQEQFANNEPGLDGFSQPDVIGNEEVDAREAE